MNLTVAKFGGTSVGNYQAMVRSANIVLKNPATKLVVVSACSGVTNILVQLSSGKVNEESSQHLIKKLENIHTDIIKKISTTSDLNAKLSEHLNSLKLLVEEINSQYSKILVDQIVSYGEVLSSLLFTEILKELKAQSYCFNVRKVMKTNNSYGQAKPNLELIKTLTTSHLKPLLTDHIVVTQGYIGSFGNTTTTLGRGGSDFSAALLAESCSADILEIWTDVPGMYTTDPRLTNKARPIEEISFSEASEMANFGAKILHPSTLIPAIRKNIPVFIGSSISSNEKGTWIKESVDSSPLFRAVTLRKNQTLITLHSLKMFQAYGFLAEVFNILARHKISVDLVTTSEVKISLTLDNLSTANEAPNIPSEALKELEELCKVEIEQNYSLVALIGNRISQTNGANKKVFNALKDYTLRLICYGASPHNMCFLVKENVAKEIVNTLHNELF